MNQPPPLVDFNPLACDPALGAAIGRYCGRVPALDELALEAGSGVAREHGRLADLHQPVLHTLNRYGDRIDEVEFHPSGTGSCIARWHTGYTPLRGDLTRRAQPTSSALRASISGPRWKPATVVPCR